MDTSTASHYIVWAFIVAAIVGTSSGWIVGKIGRHATMITACILMASGFIIGAFVLAMGPLALTASACLYYGGAGMLYSPVVSLVLGTLTQDESGRGVGMNDLFMNTTASIGIAILGTLMGSNALSHVGLIANGSVAANMSTLFLCAGAVVVIGFIVYMCTHKKITA